MTEDSNAIALQLDTYTIMVHRLYVDRVKDYLIYPLTDGLFTQQEPQRKCQVTILSKPSADESFDHEQNLFHLLLFEGIQRPVSKIHPIARQNISWLGRITHRQVISSYSSVLTSDIVRNVWTTLKKEGDFIPNSSNRLRIDCYPRNLVPEMCRQLQLEACRDLSLSIKQPADDPYGDGPIQFAMSRFKCTHRVTLISIQQERESNGRSKNHTFYWGVENQRDHQDILHLKLNNEASNDLLVVPCNNKTGEDINKNDKDPTIPLSRAYFKLEQVWAEYLKQHQNILQQGSGLDLGASPGGWTQVLVNKLKLSKVVAVDAACLAKRVMDLPQVTHIQSMMEDANLQSYGPYSIAVCDANVEWSELLDEFSSWILKKAEWCLPSIFILTMKFPFKRVASIQQNLEKLTKRLPEQLRIMENVLYPGKIVSSWHRIVHLMANSICERTLIIAFHK